MKLQLNTIGTASSHGLPSANTITAPITATQVALAIPIPKLMLSVFLVICLVFHPCIDFGGTRPTHIPHFVPPLACLLGDEAIAPRTNISFHFHLPTRQSRLH